MASFEKRVAGNVAGDFFVDSTCIDCDTCRQLAATVFVEGDGSTVVHHQPSSPGEVREALHALVSCPTGSIGSRGAARPAAVLDDFPLTVEDPVFYCGFNSPKSYGGNSYFVRHDRGNWLIDSPKFLPRLVKRFEQLGGIANIFLTHSDDVADAQRYAEHFGSRRIIHRAELYAQPGAERILDGDAAVDLGHGFVAIPTPGHTAGHCVLLLDDRFLFTGDHLAWDRHAKTLEAHEDYCWHSWSRQVASMRRLADYSFEWVLPGHGQRVWLPRAEMKRQMAQLLRQMEQG